MEWAEVVCPFLYILRINRILFLEKVCTIFLGNHAGLPFDKYIKVAAGMKTGLFNYIVNGKAWIHKKGVDKLQLFLADIFI